MSDYDIQAVATAAAERRAEVAAVAGIRLVARRLAAVKPAAVVEAEAEAAAWKKRAREAEAEAKAWKKEAKAWKKRAEDAEAEVAEAEVEEEAPVAMGVVEGLPMYPVSQLGTAMQQGATLLSRARHEGNEG